MEESETGLEGAVGGLSSMNEPRSTEDTTVGDPALPAAESSAVPTEAPAELPAEGCSPMDSSEVAGALSPPAAVASTPNAGNVSGDDIESDPGVSLKKRKRKASKQHDSDQMKVSESKG